MLAAGSCPVLSVPVQVWGSDPFSPSVPVHLFIEPLVETGLIPGTEDRKTPNGSRYLLCSTKQDTVRPWERQQVTSKINDPGYSLWLSLLRAQATTS